MVGLSPTVISKLFYLVIAHGSYQSTTASRIPGGCYTCTDKDRDCYSTNTAVLAKYMRSCNVYRTNQCAILVFKKYSPIYQGLLVPPEDRFTGIPTRGLLFRR